MKKLIKAIGSNRSWTEILLKMKLTFTFFLLGLITVSASTYSQNTRLDVSLKNNNVVELFKQIEEKSEFYFFFKDEDLNDLSEVSVTKKDATINEILDEVLKDTDMTYEVVDRYIIVRKEGDAISKSEAKADQQNRVTGRVVDEFGEPLPGVTVVIKGTAQGTVTDVNGEYSLQVTAKDAVLQYSFVGMRSQEIEVGGQSNIDVTLVVDAIGIEEVVAIGYGTVKKADVTSAVSSVKSEDFVKGSVKDVGQLIQGKVAGLTITSSSGDPLAGTSITLRGNTTLFGTSSSPLVLIDGVPGDFNAVAPEDIESIDVLKDGSAAAIYGTRGTNGVILITTKRASGDYEGNVEYTAYISTQQIAQKAEMLTAADYRQQIADGIRDASDDLGANTDWIDEITQTPFSHVHNLTFRGGNNKTNYLASLNYNDTEGIFLKTGKKTFTARTDINHSMFDDLIKFNLGILSRNIYHDNVANTNYTYRQAKIYNPTAPITNPDGTWYENPGAFNYDNPVARIKESNGEDRSQWSRLNGTVIINPFEGLTLKGLFSYSKYNSRGSYYETKNHISNVRNGLNGYARNTSVESIDRLVELTAEYLKIVGEHRFTVLGGYSYQDNDWHDLLMTNQDFPTDLFGADQIQLGTGILEGGTSSGIRSRRTKTNLIGFFGRFNYNYMNRYLLMASLRHEAASQLYGTEEPWGTFPSVSVGWRISEESFMENVSFVDDLKFRAGYGVTGTQPSNLFLGVATIGYSGSVYSNGQWMQTLAPTRNPNPYLRWEEKKETNLGVDFVLADSRVSGSIDAYKRTIDGLLYDFTVPVPPNLVTETRANVGKMENKGLEVLINVVPVRTRDFEWVSSFNFSTNSNKLVSLSNDLYQATQEYFTTGGTGEPIQTFTHRVDIGDEIGNFYGFKVIDVDEEGKWIYEDAEGNAVPSDEFSRAFEDKHTLGNGLPKFYAGWNNNFRYKNFDLAVTMRGAFGYQILNFERMYLENTMSIQYNRLQSAYDPVFGKEVLSDEMDLEYNSYYIEDGDYWKIDNITLGYTFDLDNEYIKGARVFVSSLNTFTFTGYKGVDPEVTTSGLAPGNDYRDKYPTTRTFTLGVNVNF
ncbi:TonB-dependent receptor [uncultured Draconibacterium sp.]|uniref:TonB-dependent receptor n=1 Tax=uncultured Draconibacterium sp. TaxID=1573823 RepID=UPI002AA78A9B|nr:TonB-dependent receptor [uncultured Draconibacterium sp.]